MALPNVVIVGRPNVGKSSLLNFLARARISIVDPRPGITRDRVSAVLEHAERWFELVDTGGIGMVDEHRLEDHVAQQIRYALDHAALVLFVIDAQEGVVALDQQVAELLRKLRVPIVLIGNKVDAESHRCALGELHGLGFGEPLAVSTVHNRGREDVLERIVAALADAPPEIPGDPIMKLALVGKRNAGKSTFVNQLAGGERVIVSEIPGTTRDAVDVRFEKDGRTFVAIDTAGVRKRKSMTDIDFYSYTRAAQSIARCDVAMLLVDAGEPVGSLDAQLAGTVLDAYKPLLIVLNKWDLVAGRASADDYDEYLAKAMPQLHFVPIVTTTSLDGRNVFRAVDVALHLHRQASERVSTAKLNAALEAALAEREPTPKLGSKRVRIYYATQVGTQPPTLVFSCNNPASVTENYRRFLENRLRDVLPFREVPIRMLFRSHHGPADEAAAARAAAAQKKRTLRPRPARPGATPLRKPVKRAKRK